ncbi:MAG: response regulator transcription factor [Bacteroidota bacterium]
MPITIALADDHELFLAGMRLLLKPYSDLHLLHTSNNGQELLAACAQACPDVVLLDMRMPVLNGIETTLQLRKTFPAVRIILLTLEDSPSMIQHAMKLGACGYLLKNERPEEVYHAIRTVVEKGHYFNDYVGKALLGAKVGAQANAPRPAQHLKAASVSRRELEVLELICRQRTTAEIAELLFITPRTVEGHRKKLLEKTNTRNVAGLVVYALRNGLVAL